MDTKYTNALKDNTAIMMLYGEIGSVGMSAEMFTQEMSWHNSQGRHIKVYINSPGGNVFGGYSIIQAIMDFEADTHIVGLAASMGGVVAQFGVKRTINDFGTGMIHMPSDKKKGANKLLEIVAKQLKEILTRRSNISAEQMDEIMAKDSFFDSSEMLAMGLVDEIITTNVAPITNLKEFSMSDLYNVYNSILKQDEMDKIKNHFKLDASATEEIILENIAKLETDVTNGETEAFNALEQVKNLEDENAKLVASCEELTNEIAASIVASAVESGKIEKAKEGVWLEAAKKDPKAVKAQLDAVKTASTIGSVQNLFDKDNKDVAKTPEQDVVNFFQKQPEQVAEIMNSDPERFDKLLEIYTSETSKIK